MLISTPLYAIVIGLEILLSNIHHSRSYTWRDTFHNFSLSLLSGGTDLLMKGVSLAVLAACFTHRFFTLPIHWWYWLVLLLLVDGMHYWLHRLGHQCRFFWAVHVNHHSSEHFNFTTGFRAAVFEPLYRFLIFIPIALLGFRPLDILLVFALGEIWAILTHTEKVGKLGWLEYILVTPSHHRVHHASNTRYLDRNMGSVFIIWDKLFGTFQRELPATQYEPIRYGLTSQPEKFSVPGLIFHEWKGIWKDLGRRELGWKQKLGYLFGPPGWSHDGSRHTSNQLRASAKEQAGTAGNPDSSSLVRPQ